jgi:hypothetical protein
MQESNTTTKHIKMKELILIMIEFTRLFLGALLGLFLLGTLALIAIVVILIKKW